MTILLFLVLSVFAHPALAQSFGFEDRAINAGVVSSGSNYGAAFGDYDNDGWEDIYLVRVNSLNRLYRNLGNGAFANLAEPAGLLGNRYGQCAVWGDYNNDGWLDLYLGTINGQPDRLYRNKSGKFIDISDSAGIGNLGRTRSVVWADLDNDGWLDLYVQNFLPAKNVLYRNNGDGTFTDIAAETGADESSYGMAIAPGDYDNDGDVDLYLTHDNNVPYTLLQNRLVEEGSLRFRNAASEAGVAYADQGMGADFGDYNNDGWLDLYVTNLYGNTLFRNRGDGTFENVSEIAGVDDPGMAWSTFFADCDLDGWLDIYIVKQSNYSRPPLPNVFYHNTGHGSFNMLFPYEAISSYGSGVGGAWADVNNDGAPDIFVANSTDNSHPGNHLFINNGPMHPWIKVKLVGTESNRCAIGARMRLLAGGMWQTRHITGGTGFASQNSLVQIFGLGNAIRADSLLVFWPSGRVERYENIRPYQVLTLVEGQTLTAVTDREKPVPAGWALQDGFPNPLRRQTSLSARWRLQVPHATEIRAAVYDLLGRRVRTLARGRATAGTHELRWNGNTASGRPLPAGIYFLRVQAPGFSQVKRILVLPR